MMSGRGSEGTGGVEAWRPPDAEAYVAGSRGEGTLDPVDGSWRVVWC